MANFRGPHRTTVGRRTTNFRHVGFGGLSTPLHKIATSLDYPSVTNLSSTVTINGLDGTTVFVYNGCDATTANWPASGSGDTLAIADSGDDTTVNYGSPLLDVSYDDSVKSNGGKVYQASGSSFADITTEDIYIEGLVSTPSSFSAKAVILDKEKYSLYFDTDSKLKLYLVGASGNTTVTYDTALATNSFIFFSIAVDASDDSTNGASFFVNGLSDVAITSNPSGVGSLTNSNNLTVFSDYAFNSKLNGAIAYLLLAKRANWFAGGATNLTQWAAFNQDRFYSLCAVNPQIYKGTEAPTYTRASTAFLQKTDGSGSVKYYQVGAGWPRTSKLLDASGVEFTGLEIEESAENILRYSEDLSSWSTTRIASIDSNNTSHPTSIQGHYFDGIIADTTTPANSHILSSYTASSPSGSDRYVFSTELKAGDKTWCKPTVYSSSLGSKYGYINLATGEKGSSLGSPDFGAIPLGDGRYRVWISPAENLFAETTYCYIYPTAADGIAAFLGDGLTVNIWAKHAQLEKGTYPSSYIGLTTTATVTRAADVLYYKGDDGNLGGVGSDKKGTLRLIAYCDNMTLSASKAIAAINDGGDAANEILVYVNTSGYVAATINATGGTTRTVSGPEVSILDGDGNGHKIQLTYSDGRAKLWVDGTAGAENTDIVAADIPDDLDRLQIGYFSVSDSRFYNPPVWRYLAG